MKSLIKRLLILLFLGSPPAFAQADVEIELRKTQIELQQIREELEQQRRTAEKEKSNAAGKAALDSISSQLDKKRKALEDDLEFLTDSQEKRFLTEHEIKWLRNRITFASQMRIGYWEQDYMMRMTSIYKFELARWNAAGKR